LRPNQDLWNSSFEAIKAAIQKVIMLKRRVFCQENTGQTGTPHG
jgi:hypothetical protein